MVSSITESLMQARIPMWALIFLQPPSLATHAQEGGITMASQVTEQLAQALPLLAVGAGQTSPSPARHPVRHPGRGSVTACWPSKVEG